MFVLHMEYATNISNFPCSFVSNSSLSYITVPDNQSALKELGGRSFNLYHLGRKSDTNDRNTTERNGANSYRTVVLDNNSIMDSFFSFPTNQTIFRGVISDSVLGSHETFKGFSPGGCSCGGGGGSGIPYRNAIYVPVGLGARHGYRWKGFVEGFQSVLTSTRDDVRTAFYEAGKWIYCNINASTIPPILVRFE